MIHRGQFVSPMNRERGGKEAGRQRVHFLHPLYLCTRQKASHSSDRFSFCLNQALTNCFSVLLCVWALWKLSAATSAGKVGELHFSHRNQQAKIWAATSRKEKRRNNQIAEVVSGSRDTIASVRLWTEPWQAKQGNSPIYRDKIATDLELGPSEENSDQCHRIAMFLQPLALTIALQLHKGFLYVYVESNALKEHGFTEGFLRGGLVKAAPSWGLKQARNWP